MMVNLLGKKLLPFLFLLNLLALLGTLTIIEAQNSRSIIFSQGEIIYREFLKSNGTDIVDFTGESIILRGVNVRARYTSDINKSDFEQIKSWGFNTVRLRIYWEFIEPTFTGWETPTYNGDYLENYVDKQISFAIEHGLYIILDMHQWNWSPRFGGVGVPSWTCLQYDNDLNGRNFAITDFWQNETLITHFIKMWKYVAKRYNSETMLIGYDLFNEPALGNLDKPQCADIVFPFYENLIDAVRIVDNNHMFFYNPVEGWDLDFAKKVNRTNVVYSPHCYRGSEIYDGDKEYLKEPFAIAYNQAILWNVPIFIGEFGTALSSPTYSEWLMDVTDILDEYNIGWAWWTYGKSDSMDGYDLCWANGTEKIELIQMLKSS